MADLFIAVFCARVHLFPYIALLGSYSAINTAKSADVAYVLTGKVDSQFVTSVLLQKFMIGVLTSTPTLPKTCNTQCSNI